MQKIKKRVLCTLSFLLFVFSITSHTDEKQSLEEFASSTLNTITLENFTKEQLQEVMPVTTNTIRALAGSHWKNFDDSQKEKFLVLVESEFFNNVKRIAQEVKSYRRTSTPIRKVKSKKRNFYYYVISYDFLFSTSAKHQNIQFVVALKDSQWEILDIMTDGSSLRKLFRSNWNQEIKEVGIKNFLINLEKRSS